MAWYAKSAPTHTGYKSCNEYICPKWQQAGRQHGAAFPDCLPCALHTSRRGRETFYLAPAQLDKRVSPRLPAARPSSVSVSPDRFPNNFDNFFFSPFTSEKVSRNLDGNDRRQSVVHSFLGNLYSRMFLCCLIGLGKVSSVVA